MLYDGNLNYGKCSLVETMLYLRVTIAGLKVLESVENGSGEVKEVSSLTLEEQGGRQQSFGIVNLNMEKISKDY